MVTDLPYVPGTLIFGGTRAGYELNRCNGCATQYKCGYARELSMCCARSIRGERRTCCSTDGFVDVLGALPSLFVTTGTG